MSGKRFKPTALVFVLVVLAAAERGEATQSRSLGTTAHPVTSGPAHADFDGSVHVQRDPQNTQQGPDHYDTSASGPTVRGVPFVDAGSLPSSLALLLAGLIGLVLVRYRSSLPHR